MKPYYKKRLELKRIDGKLYAIEVEIIPLSERLKRYGIILAVIAGILAFYAVCWNNALQIDKRIMQSDAELF